MEGGDGGTEGGGGGGGRRGGGARKRGRREDGMGREGEECHMSLLQNPLPDLTSVPQENCGALSCTFCS